MVINSFVQIKLCCTKWSSLYINICSTLENVSHYTENHTNTRIWCDDSFGRHLHIKRWVLTSNSRSSSSSTNLDLSSCHSLSFFSFCSTPRCCPCPCLEVAWSSPARRRAALGPCPRTRAGVACRRRSCAQAAAAANAQTDDRERPWRWFSRTESVGRTRVQF